MRIQQTCDRRGIAFRSRGIAFRSPPSFLETALFGIAMLARGGFLVAELSARIAR